MKDVFLLFLIIMLSPSILAKGVSSTEISIVENEQKNLRDVLQIRKYLDGLSSKELREYCSSLSEEIRSVYSAVDIIAIGIAASTANSDDVHLAKLAQIECYARSNLGWKNSIINFFNSYINAKDVAYGMFQKLGINLFTYLAAIDLVWMAFLALFSNLNLLSFLQNLLKKVFFWGLFLWLMKNMNSIVNWFFDFVVAFNNEFLDRIDIEDITKAGNTLSASDASAPVQIFNYAIEFFQILHDSKKAGSNFLFIYDIISIIASLLIGFLGVISFLVYIEIYILIPIFVFLLGFSGLTATQNIAWRTLWSIIGAFLKLLTLLIIIGICIGTVLNVVFSNAILLGLTEVLIVLFLAMASVALALTLPGKVSALVGGMDTGVGRNLLNVVQASIIGAGFTRNIINDRIQHARSGFHYGYNMPPSGSSSSNGNSLYVGNGNAGKPNGNSLYVGSGRNFNSGSSNNGHGFNSGSKSYTTTNGSNNQSFNENKGNKPELRRDTTPHLNKQFGRQGSNINKNSQTQSGSVGKGVLFAGLNLLNPLPTNRTILARHTRR